MLKRLVLFLLLLSPFMFSSVWAERMKEPPIVIVNGNVRVYSHVATQITGETRLESDEISIDNSVMKKVTKFYEIAQEQAKSYDESLVDKIIQLNDAKVLFKRRGMIWVSDDEIEIKFYKKRNVIASLHVM